MDSFTLTLIASAILVPGLPLFAALATDKRARRIESAGAAVKAA